MNSKKCPKCGEKMFYDSEAGPIVGGLIMMKVGKDGIVRPTEGAHPVGDWVCIKCNSNSFIADIKDFEKTIKKHKKKFKKVKK